MLYSPIFRLRVDARLAGSDIYTIFKFQSMLQQQMHSDTKSFVWTQLMF